MKNKQVNLIVLVSFLMPLGVGIQNLSLIFLFAAIFITKKTHNKIKTKDLKGLIFFLLYPITLVLSTLTNPSFLIQNSNVFLILVIPVLLSIDHGLTKQDLNKILIAFIVSVSILSLIKLMSFVFQEGVRDLLISPQKKLAQTVIKYSYLNLSMYIGTAIIFSSTFIKKASALTRTLIIINSLLLFVFLTLLSSRIILAATLFVLFLFAVTQIPKTKKLLFMLSFGVFIAVFSTSAYMLKIPIVEKMKEAVNYNDQYSNIKEKWGGRIMRQEIWLCALNLIKQKPLKGYGYNNVQHHLNECYERSSEHPVLYRGKTKKNAHNQFLQITLSIGLIGLLTFLTAIFYSIKKGIYNNFPVLCSFVTFALICFLTESHLERNHTIFLFYFFISLFLFNPVNEKYRPPN